jgi:hypothetical protein
VVKTPIYQTHYFFLDYTDFGVTLVSLATGGQIFIPPVDFELIAMIASFQEELLVSNERTLAVMLDKLKVQTSNGWRSVKYKQVSRTDPLLGYHYDENADIVIMALCGTRPVPISGNRKKIMEESLDNYHLPPDMLKLFSVMYPKRKDLLVKYGLGKSCTRYDPIEFSYEIKKVAVKLLRGENKDRFPIFENRMDMCAGIRNGDVCGALTYVYLNREKLNEKTDIRYCVLADCTKYNEIVNKHDIVEPPIPSTQQDINIINTEIQPQIEREISQHQRFSNTKYLVDPKNALKGLVNIVITLSGDVEPKNFSSCKQYTLRNKFDCLMLMISVLVFRLAAQLEVKIPKDSDINSGMELLVGGFTLADIYDLVCSYAFNYPFRRTAPKYVWPFKYRDRTRVWHMNFRDTHHARIKGLLSIEQSKEAIKHPRTRAEKQKAKKVNKAQKKLEATNQLMIKGEDKIFNIEKVPTNKPSK